MKGTSIHTTVNTIKRISSIYRKYSNQNFESYSWETLVWEDDSIVEMFNTPGDANQVVELHAELLERYRKE